MCIKLHTFSKLLKVAKSLPQKHFNIIAQSTKFRYRDIVDFKTLSPTFLVERWRLSIHCWHNEIFIERKIHFPDECNFRRELLHLSRQYRSHKSASVNPNLNCIALSLHNVIDRLHLMQLRLTMHRAIFRMKYSSLSFSLNAVDCASFAYRLRDKSTLQFLSFVTSLSLSLIICISSNAIYRLSRDAKVRNSNEYASSKISETLNAIYFLCQEKREIRTR